MLLPLLIQRGTAGATWLTSVPPGNRDVISHVDVQFLFPSPSLNGVEWNRARARARACGRQSSWIVSFVRGSMHGHVQQSSGVLLLTPLLSSFQPIMIYATANNKLGSSCLLLASNLGRALVNCSSMAMAFSLASNLWPEKKSPAGNGRGGATQNKAREIPCHI